MFIIGERGARDAVAPSPRGPLPICSTCPANARRAGTLCCVALGLLVSALESRARATPVCLVPVPSPELEAPGPFALESPSRAWSLRLRFAAQLQYELLARDLATDSGATTSDRLLVRRLRPGFVGTFFTRRLSYRLELSTAPGSLELIDLYLEYRLGDDLHVRVGQSKIPFTRFRLASFVDLAFVDWPLVTRYFGAERQLGLQVSQTKAASGGLGVDGGIFSGVNAHDEHAIALPTLFGEVPQNPSDLTTGNAVADVHPELVARVYYNFGALDASRDTDWDRGPLRLQAGVSAAWDLLPDRFRDLSLRLAPELLLKLAGVSVTAVFYLGFVRRGETVDEQRIGYVGALLQSSYLINRYFEVAARYAVVHTDHLVRQTALERARGIIAGATTVAERETLTAQYGTAGLLRQQHEVAIGVSVYLLRTSLKLASDLSWLGDELEQRTQHQVRFRTQLQLAF